MDRFARQKRIERLYKKLSHHDGFTLMELMVVLCILAVMSTICVPVLSEVRSNLLIDYAARQFQADLRWAQEAAEQNNSKVTVSFFTGYDPCKYVLRIVGSTEYLREGYFPHGLSDKKVQSITVLPDRTFQKNGHIMIKKGGVQRYVYYYQTGRVRITAKATTS